MNFAKPVEFSLSPELDTHTAFYLSRLMFTAYRAQCALPTNPIYQTLLFIFQGSGSEARVERTQGTLYSRRDCPLLVQNAPLAVFSFEHRKTGKELESGASLLVPSSTHLHTKYKQTKSVSFILSISPWKKTQLYHSILEPTEGHHTMLQCSIQ